MRRESGISRYGYIFRNIFLWGKRWISYFCLFHSASREYCNTTPRVSKTFTMPIDIDNVLSNDYFYQFSHSIFYFPTLFYFVNLQSSSPCFDFKLSLENFNSFPLFFIPFQIYLLYKYFYIDLFYHPSVSSLIPRLYFSMPRLIRLTMIHLSR